MRGLSDRVPHPKPGWLTANHRPDKHGSDVGFTFDQLHNPALRSFAKGFCLLFNRTAKIIEHLSGLMTLHPGDVITTGTPPGVGMGMKPDPVFLKAGDVMELSIGGLGQQRQTVTEDL